MRSELVQAVLLGAFIITATSPSAGADQGATCRQKKARAAGKKAAELLKAFGKDEKKPNGTKLAKRISRAESKFTKAFGKAEAKGGCLTSDDAAEIEVLVDAFVDDLALNAQEAADWPNYGGGLRNSHRGHAPGLGPETVSGLTLKWVYETTPPESPVGDVTVPPAVVDGALTGQETCTRSMPRREPPCGRRASSRTFLRPASSFSCRETPRRSRATSSTLAAR